MALFKRKAAPPDWSPFDDPDDWREFERLVLAESEARGLSGDVRESVLIDDRNNQYGLGNLSQWCVDVPRAEWPERIKQHFDVCAASEGIGDFDNRGEARVALRARLISHDYRTPSEHPLAERRVSDDLRLVLAFDLPGRVMMAPREDVLQWGPEDELFELALEQTRAEPGLELGRIEFDDGLEVFELSGDSFFTATHMLWADQFNPPESEHGTLVAVPNRHLVFAHPIRDASVIGAVNHLIRLAIECELKGPGSISRHLYWLHDGEFERLPVVVEDEAIGFHPTEGFTELLNRLA